MLSLASFQAGILAGGVAAGDFSGIQGWAWFVISLVVIVVVALLLIASAKESPKSPYLENLAYSEGHGGHDAHADPSREISAVVHTAHIEPVAEEELSFTVEQPVAQQLPAQPDDLEKIEGIGPKIAALLGQAGIHTFSQLAGSDLQTLRQILINAGLRVNDPTTWPEQARLAADGNWAEFEALTAQLKGGRRA